MTSQQQCVITAERERHMGCFIFLNIMKGATEFPDSIDQCCGFQMKFNETRRFRSEFLIHVCRSHFFFFSFFLNVNAQLYFYLFGFVLLM
jgi:hypothetical protein